MSLLITDDSILPCGKKHKGEKLKDIPGSYLLWLADQKWFKDGYPAIKIYIDDNRAALEMEVEEE